MKTNLDKWIKDARNDAPDSGEYRRLNRAILKERMDTMGTSRRRRHHRMLLGIFSLVFLMMFSGQINQLGSDSFDTTTSTTTILLSGNTETVYENVFRGGSVVLPGLSEADVEDYHRSVAAGEGELVKVTGTSYGGKTRWVKIVRRTINGEENVGGDIVHDPKPETPHDFFKFMKAHAEDFNARIKLEPPHGETKMVIDGILVNFQYWTYEYPGYGEVTRYTGTPVQEL